MNNIKAIARRTTLTVTIFHGRLSFEKLKTHPEFSKVPPAEKAANKKTLKLAFERAENIKKILKARYEQEYENAKKETVQYDTSYNNILIYK